MSGEGQRGFLYLLRTAFSYNSDTESEIEFIGAGGLVVPNLNLYEERPGSSFEVIDEATSGYGESSASESSSGDSSKSSSMSSTPPPTPPLTVTINGRVISFTATAQAVTLGNTTLYKKKSKFVIRR
jgi:hypothetical protein